jgi:hypothetical protein
MKLTTLIFGILLMICLVSPQKAKSQVRLRNHLSGLYDVRLNNLQNNDVLQWSSQTQKWENKPLTLSTNGLLSVMSEMASIDYNTINSFSGSTQIIELNSLTNQNIIPTQILLAFEFGWGVDYTGASYIGTKYFIKITYKDYNNNQIIQPYIIECIGMNGIFRDGGVIVPMVGYSTSVEKIELIIDYTGVAGGVNPQNCVSGVLNVFAIGYQFQ